MGYFDKILHIYTCQHCLTTRPHNNLIRWTRLCRAQVENLRPTTENAHNS